MDKYEYIDILSKASNKTGNLLLELMDRYNAMNLESLTVEQVKEFYEGWVRVMTANEYQKLAARTINEELMNWQQELHALHGMVGEIGEIHSIYQKAYQGHDASDEHLKKEVGDLLWFIAEYCTANDWNLEDIMQINIDKLKARFPEGFEVDKSLNRAEGDI